MSSAVPQSVAAVDLVAVRAPLDAEATGVRFVPEATWGAEKVRVFAFDVR